MGSEKVIFITGASSGIGKATAKLFQTKNWKVAATMRNPDDAKELQNIADIECFTLDVTDSASIRAAMKDAIAKFGKIDAVVNNAGYAVTGAFEAASEEQIKRQFETNVFGLMNVTREFLPFFRERKRGMFINIASVGGRVTFPLYSIYNSTKWAVEGFSESLAFEMRPFNIKVKIIEPGPIKTDFYDRSMQIAKKDGLSAYDAYISRVLPKLEKAGANAPGPEIVAEVVYNAATDSSMKLRYSANSAALLAARKILPDAVFRWVVKTATH
ncbi:MAG: SDR family oxidoreductase [Pyrinomonadaceae bacterium]